MPTRGGQQRIPRPEGVVPGPPPPWSGLPEDERRVSLARVRAAVAGRTPGSVVLEPFAIRRPAAVLVPLYEVGHEARLILTRRPWTMRAHAGEVSFPGGGRERSDRDLVDTALREAEEEIGLPPRQVEVIGQLDPLATLTSGAHITPFVGVVHGPPTLAPAPGEVEAVLHLPLRELLEPGAFHEERWPPVPGMTAAFPSPDGRRPMYFFEVPGDTIWGATARMLFQLLTLATGTGTVGRDGPVAERGATIEREER